MLSGQILLVELGGSSSDSASSSLNFVGHHSHCISLNAGQSLAHHTIRNIIPVLNLFSDSLRSFWFWWIFFGCVGFFFPLTSLLLFRVALESSHNLFSDMCCTDWVKARNSVASTGEEGKLRLGLKDPSSCIQILFYPSWSVLLPVAGSCSPVSGSHISPNFSTRSCACGCVFSWWNRLCTLQTFPSLCLINLNFSA